MSRHANLFLILLQFQDNIKLYHFQTKRFGAHTVSDKLHAALILLLDKFLESYQGVYGRIPPIDNSITIRTLNDKEIISYSKRFIVQLRKSTRELCKKPQNSSLCNILDEIVAEVEKFVYLLTFK